MEDPLPKKPPIVSDSILGILSSILKIATRNHVNMVWRMGHVIWDMDK